MTPARPMVASLVYEFGPYRLEVPTRRLLRDGEPVSLTPKAFDTLLALIERRDRVVDKAELMQLVWPDSFVEEANVSQTIFVLRKILGTDAAGRPLIDTVPRRGYRFAAAMEASPFAPAAAPGAAVLGTPSTSSPSRRRKVKVAAAIVLVAAGAVALWRLERRPLGQSDPAFGKPRLMVLPFENLTRNREDDWLASAFSDSITSALRDLDDVVVISRDRIGELYAARDADRSAAVSPAALRAFTASLGVKYYVRGTYQRVGEQLRVAAGVTEADSGAIQEQETITGSYVDLLRLEDDLAGKLASRLPATRHAPRRPETTSVDAYKLFTEAQGRYDRAEELAAIETLKAAIRIDPGYAAAWALLSKSYSRAAAPSAFSGGRHADYPAESRAAALRATELDPSLYEAHIARALSARAQGRADEWRAEAQAALTVNPRLAEAYELLADTYFAPPSWGCAREPEPARAEDLFREALRIDSRLGAAYANLTYHLHWLLRLDDSIRTANEGLAVLPGHAALLRARSSALMFAGRLDEAARDIDAVSDRGNALSIQDEWVLASIDERRGDLARAAREYADVVRQDPRTVYDLSIARVYLTDGHAGQAAEYLKRAIAAEQACRRYLDESPAFAPYRSLPQIAPLLTPAGAR